MSINWCSSCDIAFDGRDCPLCKAKDEILFLEEEIRKLQE